MAEADAAAGALDIAVERNLQATAAAQPFLRHVGYRLTRFGRGFAEAEITVGPEHAQQDRYIHGGVLATLADVTGGCAELSGASAVARVLTIEFKISFLEPAEGERILCRARVLRQGRRISLGEADIIAVRDGRESLVAKALTGYALRESEAKRS